MEIVWLFSPLTISLLLFLVFKLVSLTLNKHNLPPSPALKFPIIGHLYILKQHIHRTLENLSEKHGPIFSLQLGKRLVVVVSSPSSVKECFTKNDVVLADRPPLMIGGYNCTTIIDSCYGDHWRNLRRICALEILSVTSLNKSKAIRQFEVKFLLNNLFQNCNDFGTIFELKSKFSELSFNVIMRMVSGDGFFDQDKGKAVYFRELIDEFFSNGGASNVDDFLPVPFGWIYKFIKKNALTQLGEKLDEFLQDLIDEYRGVENQNTMIDNLLSLQESQPDYYTDDIIKGIILVIVIGGTDTTAVTIEWAMTHLLNNPKVLNKVKIEIDNHVGYDRLVNESDLPNLKYLQSIISETFRLSPAAPMLIPHQSSDDTKIGGFDVPRGTILLVNAWAVHRDPFVWADDPGSFRPERFEGIDVKPWELLPFGMGRRICPGAGLAQRVIALTVGSLVQCFEWEIVSKDSDIAEGSGLTLAKAEPLAAKCKARDIAYALL
ncbi:cytochrome P450 81D11-like [Solanum pennellii]|uniref:Cytochrome P450 81D11-like n=1 Tax=Solanum pennellii TaxID=28526 RepID=A0ABM1G1T2_SOLPN|nr:cytochrome P450 81D11-like [Solanum pennellii]